MPFSDDLPAGAKISVEGLLSAEAPDVGARDGETVEPASVEAEEALRAAIRAAEALPPGPQRDSMLPPLHDALSKMSRS